ncbi:MAG: hypothetical protein ABIH72_00645 [archaeon]
MSIIEKLRDIFYVNILDMHKHNYQRNGTLLVELPGGEVEFPYFQCTGCGRTITLEEHQMEDNVGTRILYEKRDNTPKNIKTVKKVLSPSIKLGTRENPVDYDDLLDLKNTLNNGTFWDNL